MLIKEIELNNYRIYKGVNTISLLPDGEKNIIVISGKNGFGKTTFLMSLVWCLFGRQMEKVDALYHKEIIDQGGYGKYIGNSLNRLAKAQGETSFSVSITFSKVKIPEITCEEVKVTRSYDSIGGEKIEVLVDGRKNELIQDIASLSKQAGEEVFINDFILPREIAKFFLFDAEKIVSLAEANSPEQRRQLSQAYTEVLGIKKYEDLKNHLEDIQDEYRKKSAKPSEKSELSQIVADIEKATFKGEELEKHKQQLEEEKSEKGILSSELQIKLIKEGNQITLEQLNGLKKESEDYENKIKTLSDNLKEHYELIPFAFAGEAVLGVAEQLNLEKTAKDIALKQENVQEKTSAILDDLEREKQKLPKVITADIRDFYESQIKILVQKHFFSDHPTLSADFAPLHNFSDTEINEFNTLVDNLKHSFREKFERLHSEYVGAKSGLDRIRRSIREAEKNADDAYIGQLRSDKDAADKRIMQLAGEIEQNNVNKGELQGQLKALRQRQEELRKRIDESSKYGHKEQKAQEIIQQLKVFIKDFKEEKKKSLENRMLHELDALMHKKGFIKSVAVDISQSGEDVDINLYNARNEKIDKGSLSMGERQMYASALLKALVDESDIEFPVFIDSPMQKFDKDHALSIIKEFYPNVSEQVVIFPLIHKEINKQEFDLLRPKVSHVYLIQNTDIDTSKFVKIDPDKLMLENTDMELEHAS